MPTRKNRPKVVPSSGNVFADLGITNADEKQTKARLAVAMNQIIQGRKLSQMAAARRLKVKSTEGVGSLQLPIGRFFCRTAYEFCHSPGP